MFMADVKRRMRLPLYGYGIKCLMDKTTSEREKCQPRPLDDCLADIAGKILGYKFGSPSLIKQALTHTSWANEAGCADVHNERLEFLGDAVLELCVSTELYRRYPLAREGDLTRMRARMVNAGSLAGICRSLGLDQLLRLGAGEEKQGGRARDAILCDVLEAVIAAIYEDGGFDAAQAFVARIFAACWPEKWHEPQSPDHKSALQELCQRLFHIAPAYSLESSSGPDHARMFTILLRLPDGQEFHASASSCKKAEQVAAGMALAALRNDAP